MDERIVRARDLVLRALDAAGADREAARLDGAVVLVARGFLRRLAGRQDFPEVAHPVLSEARRQGGTLFLPDRVGSPALAVTLEQICVLGPSSVVHVGLAGALDPALAVGDVVVSRGALNETGTGVLYGHRFDELLPADEALAARLEAWAAAAGLRARAAPVWSTDAPFRETTEKVHRYRALGAVAVEMEGAALFAVTEELGIPAGAVYLVSDCLVGGTWEVGFYGEPFRVARDRFVDALAELPGALVDA